MKFETPNVVLKHAAEDPQKLDLHLHFQKFYLANLDKHPSTEQADQAAAYLSKLTSIRLTGEQVVEILRFYPRARILLAVMGADEPSVHGELQFLVAHFFLSSAWPKPEEGVDLHDFTSYLRRQAVELGYTTLQGSNEFISAADDYHDEDQPDRLHIPAAPSNPFMTLLSKLLNKLPRK